MKTPKIQVVLVPADARMEVRTVVIVRRLRHMQSLVGGQLEALPLFNPNATLYFNEEGRPLRLSVNARATNVLWAKNSIFSGVTRIRGDAFIAGPPDLDGFDTDAPSLYASFARRFPRLL